MGLKGLFRRRRKSTGAEDDIIKEEVAKQTAMEVKAAKLAVQVDDKTVEVDRNNKIPNNKSTNIIPIQKSLASLETEESEEIGCGAPSQSYVLRIKNKNEKKNSPIVAVEKQTFKARELVDLADENQPVDDSKAAMHRTRYKTQASSFVQSDPVAIIRENLPPDPLLSTPFGVRRMTYADYTASGRSLRFLEEYIERVVTPLYANTHTETSASGLQTTHYREEARAIIMESLDAKPTDYSLIFTGTGVTAAIWKVIALLGIHCPVQLEPYLDQTKLDRPLILVSQSEHHSNELMWRETIADVLPIPPDETGSLDLNFLRQILQENHPKYKTIIGSFSAGSNVTGLMTKPGPVAALMHEFGGFACFDYAGAGPYVSMKMTASAEDPKSYLDAIFISPHKFVGGPGTPGLLCIRKEFADCRGGLTAPPTVAGGGTVKMVWPSDVHEVADSNRSYETVLHAREEAGTPGIMESIRCGLAFHVRDMVGVHKIEEIEGAYAQTAVQRLQKAKIWVMGDVYSNITSKERLSITSFNVWCKLPRQTEPVGDTPAGTLIHPQFGRPLMLHPHFVAALLNDVYGIQARSGCACAGPLSFRLFGPRFPYMTKEAVDNLVALAEEDFHALKPGFCRVNFNYFIPKEEFEYIVQAIEQIAEHGWKLLPLYALCLKTGQYWYNGINEDGNGTYTSFNRFDAVRRLREVEFEPDGTVCWNECRFSEHNRHDYLQEALKIYDDAPNLVRKMLFRFRNLRRRDVQFPEKFQKYRFFALGTEVLQHLGISSNERERASTSDSAKNDKINPLIVAIPKHETANPFFTMDRPRG